jgi:Tol biopolymer transport system component
MKSMRFCESRLRCLAKASLLPLALVLALLLAACESATVTPQVLVVTATFTSNPAVQVVTATFTPGAQVQVVTATFSPVPQVQVVTATYTPTPESPAPGPTPQPPAQGGIGGTVATSPPQPTATLQPPPPTETSLPEPTATTEAKPTAKPVSLASYFVVYTHFQGPDVQNYSLWGMDGDGSDAFQIEGAGQSSEPAFSPDGNKFAFYHWTDGIYIWDLVKQTSTRIVDNGEASFPTWSPNSQRLAYCNLLGQPAVYIVNSDGSDNHQLTPGLRPNWSLQGGFIAYDSCENNKCGIFRINPGGGGRRQLTTDGGGGAAVSPDGKKIAYWSQADGDFEIYVVNADGSGQKQLTKNRGNDALPAWSPDGKVIYYLSDQNGTAWAVMAMNADGSNPRRIVKTNGGSDPQRGWQYQRITVTWNG